MTLRLRGSKTELEEMGEDVSDMATTTSQLQAKLLALTGGQVDIMLDANTFKNSTQILREMAEAWEDMNDIQRASALELMGGKRQANVLSALIQNFDTVEKAIETSVNSAGSALKENERYLDSIQGKIDQFNNAMQAMWSDTLDSDTVKWFVELATQLVKIVDAVGPLNIAFVGLFTFLEKKYGLLGNLFKPAGDSVKELKEQLVKAQQDLEKATEADLRSKSKKTAQARRDAEERVTIAKERLDKASAKPEKPVREKAKDTSIDAAKSSKTEEKLRKQLEDAKADLTKIERESNIEAERIAINETYAADQKKIIESKLGKIEQKEQFQNTLKDAIVEREDIQKELRNARQKLDNITANGIQEDIDKFASIDMSAVDNEIVEVGKKLREAEGKKNEAQSYLNKSRKEKWQEQKDLGKSSPAEAVEEADQKAKNAVAQYSNDVSQYSQELEQLREKKEKIASSKFQLEVSKVTKKEIQDLQTQLDGVNDTISQTVNSLNEGVNVDDLKRQLSASEKELEKATQSYKKRPNAKNKQKMREAQDSVGLLKERLQPEFNRENQEKEAQKKLEELIAEREKISGDLEAAKKNLVDITTNGVQTELYDAVKIDTTEIDAKIDDIDQKLNNARKKFADAKAKTRDDYVAEGSKAPSKERNAKIDESIAEVQAYEKQLGDLKSKRDELVQSGIAIEVTESSKENVDKLDQQIKGLDIQIQDARKSLESFGRVDTTNIIDAGDDIVDLRKQLAAAEQDLAKAEADDAQRRDKFGKKKKDAEARVNALSGKLEPYDNVNDLKKQREDLLVKQAEAQQKVGAPDATEEAKQDLATINSQLDQTNKELAEAEARLAAIDKNFKPSSITDVVEDAANDVADTVDAFDPKKAKNSITGKKGARTKRIKQLQAEGKSFDEIQEDPKIKQWTQEVKAGEQALDEYNAKVAQADATLKQKNATTVQATGAERAKAGAEAADAGATNASAAAEAADTTATTTHTAATWADVWAEMTRTGATGASVAATIKQVLATKLASSALVQKGLAIMGVTAAEGASIPVTTMLAGGFVGLATSIWSAITAMWTFMTTTPIGWILLAVGAVVALGAAFAAIHKTTEELQEELDGFKSKLSDIESELDSVNQELETTKERMEELLAKDKLTFEEQEELDRLRETNDELERRKELLDNEKEAKKGLVGRQAARVVESARSDTGFWERALPVVRYFKTTEEEEANKNIEKYQEIKEKLDNASSSQERKKYQDKLDKKAEEIDEYISTLSDALDGVEYGDSEESDEALDHLAEIQDNYGIARGSAGAKTNAIKGIFKKPEFKSMSKAIDHYVNALRDGDESASASIAEIINGNEELVEDLQARGLEAEDAIKYFTQLGDSARFDTLEGKTEEIKKATDKLPEAFKNIGNFMDGDEVDKTAIAEYFKGTSDKTREEIAKLIKDINDGEIDVEHALQKFDLFGVQSVLEIEITEVQTNFKDTFTDLESADGLIDTFNELADAIGSTSNALDALNSAQAEMKASGRVSIETALKLMEYTDDYSKVLTISEGKLVLTEDAEENLIEARIEGMKASSLKALEEARAARETIVSAKSNAEAALSTYNSAMETELSAAVTASAWDKVLAAAAGLWAGIKSIFTDESWTEAYDRAYQETLSSRGENRVEEVKAKYATAEEQAKKAQLEKEIEDANKALEEQDEEIKKLEGNNELISGLTKDNIGDVFKSDNIEDPEDAEDDAFQKEMDYWENRIGANQARYEQLQNEIDLLEAKGQKADASFYEEQIKLEGQRLTLLEGQKAAALAHLDTLEEGSEEWWEVANTLNDIEGELDDVTASIVDLQDAIGEIDTYKFEEFNGRLDDITSKLGTIRDLIAPNGEEDWFDDEGNWTEDGVAVLGTYVQELETYKQGLAEAQAAYANYTKEYAGNEDYYASLGIHSEQELYDKREELIDQQYTYSEAISNTKQDIVGMYENSIDAVEEYTEALIDSYNDYIDSVKEALDAERDLYDFKKNVQKQSKDISAIERRIASLSGSTNASDVAERRKLEAQLYESRESLNDTYYDHARSAQDEALDAEQTAYEESMNKFVEGLRTSLETATANMDEFLMGVTSMVMYNADTVLTKYQETNLPLTDELTNPWIKAKEAVGTYSGDALALMNKWTEEGGFFAQFNTTGTKNLKSPWSAGSTAANAFKTSVDTVMEGVVSNISTNVKTASGELSKLYQQIQDTEKRAAEAKVDFGAPEQKGYNPNPTPQPAPTPEPTVKLRGLMKTSKEMILGSKSFVDANTETINGTKYYRDSKTGYYYKISDLNSNRKYDGGRTTGWAIPKGTWFYTKHAKGTTGTTRDEWALTDEPQFGDELVLVPGKDGNLSFMRKGTGVVPADMTKKLFELAQIPTSDLMNKNLTAVVPNITKNDFTNEFNFESLVHVDTVDSDTLPKLEKMVDKKIDDFSKALNYSLKRFAR